MLLLTPGDLVIKSLFILTSHWDKLMAPSTKKKNPLVGRQKAKGKHSLEVRGRWFCQTFSSLLECNIQLTAQVKLHSMNAQLKRETPSASQR